ncbi:MAG: ShlB/FhaC/HecB family hemolysin secretion/activation protein [Betaproteobacteria bacterium]|nr:ShlB/FhaC/HecB family hemolysin secretion/activation protein [Betaproteobacteria bacterium]
MTRRHRGGANRCGGRGHTRGLGAALIAAAALHAPAVLAQPAAAPAAPAARTSSASTTAGTERKVVVDRYTVQGNTLLAAEHLREVTAPFLGIVGPSDLAAAAAAVQQAYRRAGWGGVVAFLPEQDFAGGTAIVRVVEGRLARYVVAENRRFNAANVRASLPSLQRAKPVNVRRVDTEIQMANENPAKTVAVMLEPGDQFGAVNAFVTVHEQPVSRFTARDDNTGSKATGRWRAALGWQHANVWDLDHVFAIEGQTAPEDPQAVKVFSTSYRAPLYEHALAVDGYYAWSNVDGGRVDTAAGELQFAGRGSIAGARLSAYLARLGNTDQRLQLGLESRAYRNTCTIAGLPPGACGAAGESVSVQPMSLTWTLQATSTWRWGLSMGLHHNLAFGGQRSKQAAFDAVRPGARRRYTLARMHATLGTALGESFAVNARLALQGTGDPLVPGEMFGLGGANTVRGYEERELNGDSGAALSLELAGWNWGASLGERFASLRGFELRPILFADAGAVQNRDDAPCRAGQTRCPATSAGIGLRAGWRDLQLRIDAAHALKDAGVTQAGHERVHASLAFNF